MQGNENGLRPWQAGIVGRITCFHERSNSQGIKNRDGAASLDASLVQIAAERLELGKISHGGKRAAKSRSSSFPRSVKAQLRGRSTRLQIAQMNLSVTEMVILSNERTE